MIDNFTIPPFPDQWDLCRGTEDHCGGTEAKWYLHLSGHAPGVIQTVENVKYSMIFLPGCPKQCCNLWWDPLLAVWQDDQTWALLPLAYEGHLRWHQLGWWQWCWCSLPQDSPPGLVATSPSRSATASSSSTPGTWLSLAMCGGRLPQGESLSYLPTRNTDDKLFRFRNMPEILGYELLNEPWTGDFYQVSWIVCTKISLNLIFVP